MNYENKHKEEIVRAIQLWECGDITRENLEYIFPELNEDERIKKSIIKFLIDVNNGAYTKSELEIASWIDWLEKQSKQKETLCDKCKKEQPSHSCQDITALGRCAIEKQDEKSSIRERYDRIKNSEWFKKTHEGMSISEEEQKFHIIDEGKDEMDYCFTKMMNGEKVNSAWSEEDEKMVNRLIGVLDGTNKEDYHEGWEDIFLPWLKSLKDRVQPQNKWKPSKEQIIALRWVLNNIPYNKHKEEINGLLDQIKDLFMEE